MNWSQPNKGRNRLFVVVGAIIVIVSAALFFDTPLRDTMRAGMRNMAAVAWVAADGAGGFFDHYGGFSSRATLASENATLRAEVARLESLSLHNDVLRSENATLRDMFSLREAHPEGMAAPILSNPSTSPYGTFIIGSGMEDGIKVGDYVLSAPRVAIGRVVEADARTALVHVFSAPGEKSEVMIEKVRATYVGRGDGNGDVVVPRGVEVKLDDAAQLAGTPFAIGFVGFIQKNPEDSETIILVRVPTNLPSLSFVYIVPEK